MTSMLCDECWLHHEPGVEWPLTLVLAMIVPSEVTENDVVVNVPETAQVEFFRLAMTSVVIVRDRMPFDSRKVVTAMKEWIGSTEPLDDERWNEDGDV